MKFSAKIGSVEIASDEVRIAVVKTGGKTPKLLECVSAPIEQLAGEAPAEAWVRAVQQAAGQIKSKPSFYVLCASSQWSVARLLRIPFKGRSRVAAAVQFELEPHLAFPIEQLVVDYLPIREIDGETQVIVVGLRREALEEQLAALEGAGLRVEGIGLDAVGLTALWQARAGKRDGLHAVLHVRRETAIVAVVYGKTLAYIRNVSATAARFQENPGAAARDVSNILRAFTASWGGDEEIQTLSVTGLELFDEERALFQAEVPAAVEFVNLANSIKGAANAADAYLGCIGAAECAAGGAFALNFMKDDLSTTASRGGVFPHLAFTAALGAVALGAYAAYCVMDYRWMKGEVDRLGLEVWEQYAAAYPQGDIAQKRSTGDVGGVVTFDAMMKAADAEREAVEAFNVETFSRPTLLEVLKVLAEHMPDAQMAVTDLKITVLKNAEITISGEIRDSAAFQEVIDALQRSDVIKLTEPPDRNSQGGRETFTIKATG